MRIDQLPRIEHTTPLRFYRHDLSSHAACHIRHAQPEETVDADDRGISRLEQVRQRGLHPRRTRPRNCKRERVLSAEYFPEPSIHVIHQSEELRVQMAERRMRQGLEYTWGYR